MTPNPLRYASRSLLVLTGMIFLGGCTDDLLAPASSSEDTPPPAASSPATSALAGLPLWVQPGGSAAVTAAAWKAERPSEAALLEQLAATPQAVWIGGWESDVTGSVHRVVSAATGAAALPVLVLYNIPNRDCGHHSAGGVSDGAAYRQWVRNVVAGIGGRPAVVLLEPDALAAMECLSAAQQDERVALLRDAVTALSAHAATRVYVDAGHPAWHAAEVMAERLQRIGVAGAAGFALNVANFVDTETNVAYGAAISARIGGKHFIVDTSRNGAGAAPGGEWCNPAGRAVGRLPTTNAGIALVDALLWIKRPGESDGPCNGGPAAGVWWAEYALGLMQRGTA